MGAHLLTVAEAAAELAVHPKTVRRLVERGELAAVKVGAAVRLHPDDLVSFIDAHRTRRPHARREFPRPSVTRAAGTGFAERLRSIQREHSPQEAR